MNVDYFQEQNQSSWFITQLVLVTSFIFSKNFRFKKPFFSSSFRKASHSICLLVFCLSSINFAQAQSESDNNDDMYIPPMKVVIDSVLSRNNMLKFRKHHVGVKESTLASERIYWTRNLGIQGDARFGNLNNFATNVDGPVTSSILTTTEQVNYSVGFYVKIPIFDVLNRKNQLGLAKLEIEEAKSMAQFQEDEIRQTVIQLYQNLILKQKVLKIRSKSLGDARVNIEMVEKEFRNGVVPISEYVRINSMTADMEADYEKAMSEFITAKQLLEDMSGFVFGLKPSN